MGNIAIIGGGAAGMISAYLLDKAGHAVTVYEKQALLGGNIRTLNKNVPADSAVANLHLEGGVIEFSEAFTGFKALLDELEVPYANADIGTALFLKNGKQVHSSIMIRKNFRGLARLDAYLNLFRVQLGSLGMGLKLRRAAPADLRDVPLGELLPHDRLGAKWLKVLMMYSYSMPYGGMADFSAEVAVRNIQKYMFADWFHIRGGVYSYIEKILAGWRGNLELEANIQQVARSEVGVTIHLGNGEQAAFDKVVFAIPPDKILPLLATPSAQEQQWFMPWKANLAETIIHSDASIYTRYGIEHPSEFDFFENDTGWGYNALLNQVCEIDSNTPYFLSYNIRERLDPTKIVHVFQHETPGYSAAAVRYRADIKAGNGSQNTFYAGAWLGDGLHEGATQSAIAVAKLMQEDSGKNKGI